MKERIRSRLTALVLAIMLIVSLAACGRDSTNTPQLTRSEADSGSRSSGYVAGTQDTNSVGSAYSAPIIGEIIQFGGYDWRTLDVEDGKALIISQYLFSPMLINEEAGADYTWETSSLREYLNNEFYTSTFTASERSQILDTTLINADNQWSGISGGNYTTDKIFLLSIDEAVRCFASDKNVGFALGPTIDYQADNNRRRASYSEPNPWHDDVTGYEGFWWLRSPGESADSSATVERGGYINLEGRYSIRYTESGPGHGFLSNPGGVRPAMWITLASANTSNSYVENNVGAAASQNSDGAFRDTYMVFIKWTAGYWSEDLKEFDIKGCLEANGATVSHYSSDNYEWNMNTEFEQYGKHGKVIISAVSGHGIYMSTFNANGDRHNDDIFFKSLDEADTDVWLNSVGEKYRIDEGALATILQWILAI